VNPHGPSQARSEAAVVRALIEWTREELYGVVSPAPRATAVSAIAAAAAERAYRLTDDLPRWQNDTSAAWRGNLARVWDFLAGDVAQHYELSAAIAAFLTSPLNHVEGQDGPDDFDRPQTLASFAAVASVVMWGVDFAITAVDQVFECVELRYDGAYSDARVAEVDAEARAVHASVDLVIVAVGRDGVTPGVIAALRG
jgi:hypothetical protein